MRGLQALSRWSHGSTTSRGRTRRSTAARAVPLILAALSLMLSACAGGLGGQPGNGALAATQTLTWPYVSAIGSFGHNEVLDPAVVSTVYDANDIQMLYMGLVTFDSTQRVVGDAAKTWSVDQTGTIFTFHLRPNLAFSDGKPITAADFAYSIDRALDPTLCSVQSAKTYNSPDSTAGCYWAGPTYLGQIIGACDDSGNCQAPKVSNGDDPTAGINVLDAQTLRIRLQHAISYFLNALTYSTADVVEKSMVQNPAYAGGLWVDHLDQGGTSGPFKLTSYGNGSTLTFVPNPYWEKAFGQNLSLTKVTRPLLPKVDQEYTQYRAGNYDVTEVPADEYSFARGQADFHTTSALTIEYFGLNETKPPFDSTAVRQAFDLALNKQLLVDTVENGGAIPTNHLVPQGMPGFDVGLKNPPPDNTQSLTGNQTAARALIQQAAAHCPPPGTYGAPPDCAFITGTSPQEIDLYAPDDDPSLPKLAQGAAQMWNDTLGVNVVVKSVPFGTVVGYIITPAAQDPASMWEIGWIADYPDPQDWLSLQFHTGAGNNAEGFSNKALDAQMNAADIEQNQVKRMQMYNQIEQAIVNDAVRIPFQQSKQYWRQRDYVRGFGFNSFGLMMEHNWPQVYIAQH